jgi:uncharacterized Ntn-hydrolase superfamily protein
MTFSIVARCQRSGELGAAVTTAWFAVGSLCPAVRHGIGAVASQADVNPRLRTECLDRLARGVAADITLGEALSTDPSPERRQVGLIDASGRTAAHTGDGCVDAHGHIIESNCVIAGNTLLSTGVLDAVAASWRDTNERDFGLAERMMLALEAGQEAGGDKRGRQSAALLVGNKNPMLQIDLRVDDHADPLVELRRLLTMFREKYEPFYEKYEPLYRSAPGVTSIE